MRRVIGLPLLGLFASLAIHGVSRAQKQTAGPAPDASIMDLRILLDKGQVTSSRLVEFYLDRIARYDGPYADQPGINSVITVNPDARSDAAQLDRERLQGRVRGPLHGIPLLVKDNIDVFGLPTSGGNASLRNYRPRTDAFVIARLRKAGAIILGKTNLHEFAWDSTTVSSVAGQTFNPYDQRRDSGGSSGGSAAAVAAGFAPAAVGTDTGGSLRIPAAHTNLVSIRATFGRISRSGVMPMTFRQDQVGPIARTVEDAALLLNAMSGLDPEDKFSLRSPALAFAPLATARANMLEGKTIAILSNPEYRGSGKVEAIVASTVRTFKRNGAKIVDLQLPQSLVDALKFSGVSLTMFEMRPAIDAYFARGSLNPQSHLAALSEPKDMITLSDIVAARSSLQTVQPWLERMLTLDEREYQRRLVGRTEAIAQLEAIMTSRNIDTIGYPSVLDTAPLAGASPPGDNGQLSPLTGFPAVTIPAGFTDQALPVGFELMGLPDSDVQLLGMAGMLEAATNQRSHRAPRLGME